MPVGCRFERSDAVTETYGSRYPSRFQTAMTMLHRSSRHRGKRTIEKLGHPVIEVTARSRSRFRCISDAALTAIRSCAWVCASYCKPHTASHFAMILAGTESLTNFSRGVTDSHQAWRCRLNVAAARCSAGRGLARPTKMRMARPVSHPGGSMPHGFDLSGRCRPSETSEKLGPDGEREMIKIDVHVLIGISLRMRSSPLESRVTAGRWRRDR